MKSTNMFSILNIKIEMIQKTFISISIFQGVMYIPNKAILYDLLGQGQNCSQYLIHILCYHKLGTYESIPPYSLSLSETKVKRSLKNTLLNFSYYT